MKKVVSYPGSTEYTQNRQGAGHGEAVEKAVDFVNNILNKQHRRKEWISGKGRKSNFYRHKCWGKR